MATKKKRNGDADPAVGGSEEIEEKKENRVIAGIKALLSEFDGIHKEAGVDPGVTDEESACMDKIRDFLDGFHNRGSEDEPGEEAGTSMDPMDEFPDDLKKKEGEDEEPEVGGEDEDWPDNGSAPKGRAGDRKRVKDMDTATIEKRITDKFRAKDRALDECDELLGSVSKARTLDSALAVYKHALKTNGIEFPEGANLEGLRGMVAMHKKARAGDSMPMAFQQPTGIEAQVAETIVKSPYAPRTF